MIQYNFKETNWYITCFNENPSNLTEDELLDFIDECCKNGENHITEDLRGGYKLKLYINDFINKYPNNLEIENNSISKSINYKGQYFIGDKKYIGSRYFLIKT